MHYTFQCQFQCLLIDYLISMYYCLLPTQLTLLVMSLAQSQAKQCKMTGHSNGRSKAICARFRSREGEMARMRLGFLPSGVKVTMVAWGTAVASRRRRATTETRGSKREWRGATPVCTQRGWTCPQRGWTCPLTVWFKHITITPVKEEKVPVCAAIIGPHKALLIM